MEAERGPRGEQALQTTKETWRPLVDDLTKEKLGFKPGKETGLSVRKVSGSFHRTGGRKEKASWPEHQTKKDVGAERECRIRGLTLLDL